MAISEKNGQVPHYATKIIRVKVLIAKNKPHGIK